MHDHPTSPDLSTSPGRSWRRLLLGTVMVATPILAVATEAPSQATSSLATVAAPDPPVLADLRLQVATGADWTVVTLNGASVVDSHVVSNPPLSSVSMTPSGISIWNGVPSAEVGRDTSAPATAVVNIIYSLPASAAVTLQICRGNLGTTTATLSRLAPNPAAITTLADSATSGWAGSCADPGATTLGRASVTGQTRWLATATSSRHTLAVYYPWWDPTSFDAPPVIDGYSQPGAWPDTPQQPFDTTTEPAVAAQVTEAASHGINGFLTEYNGTDLFASRAKLVTEAAEARSGFTVAPLVDLTYLPGVTAAYSAADQARTIYSWTVQALSTTAGPAQLTEDGRPVVFYYDTAIMPPSVWTQAARLLDGAGQLPFAVGDSVDPTYAMPGLFAYSPNSVADHAQLPDFYFGMQQSAYLENAVGNQSGSPRLLVEPVSPGMNNTEEEPLLERLLGIDPGNIVDISRVEGQRYADSWSSALATQPDWILVSTWNEWVEDTGVAPSHNAGDLALLQTGEWARVWQSASDL
jgi:hypothetical protein